MPEQAQLDPEEMTDSTVSLGDVQFDPVAERDFRLSGEEFHSLLERQR